MKPVKVGQEAGEHSDDRKVEKMMTMMTLAVMAEKIEKDKGNY